MILTDQNNVGFSHLFKEQQMSIFFIPVLNITLKMLNAPPKLMMHFERKEFIQEQHMSHFFEKVEKVIFIM